MTDNLDEAMERARERGKDALEEIFSQPDMLTVEEVSKIIGMSTSIVGVCRDNGGLIALPMMNGYCYPKWQFDEKNGVVIKGIRDIVAMCDGSWLTAYKHLTSEYPDADGKPVYEKLRQGEIDAVLSYLGGVLDGAFT